MTDDLKRDRVVKLVRAYEGLAYPKREYVELLFPHDEPRAAKQFAAGMSSCALTVLAAWRDLGLDDPELQAPYAKRIGKAVADVVAIAKRHGAWVDCVATPPSKVPLPGPGDVVLHGRNKPVGATPQQLGAWKRDWGGDEHVLTVVDVRGDVVISIDGGQPGIAEKARTWTVKGGQVWLGARRVVGYCRASDLPIAASVVWG